MRRNDHFIIFTYFAYVISYDVEFSSCKNEHLNVVAPGPIYSFINVLGLPVRQTIFLGESDG